MCENVPAGLFTQCVGVCYSSDCNNKSHYIPIQYIQFWSSHYYKGGESDVLCCYLQTLNRAVCSKGVGTICSVNQRRNT